MNFIEEPKRKTPIIGEYDVIVVGGGVAGIVSAIASSRNGAKTCLIEQYGFLGGTATAGLMVSINGFRNQLKPNHIQTVSCRYCSCPQYQGGVKPRELSVRKLQDILKSQGAVISRD